MADMQGILADDEGKGANFKSLALPPKQFQQRTHRFKRPIENFRSRHGQSQKRLARGCITLNEGSRDACWIGNR